MLQGTHLIGGEAILAAKLFQVVDIGSVGVALCGKVACNGAAVTRQHYAVTGDNGNTLGGSAVIGRAHADGDFLRCLVALVVAVIDSTAVLIEREAFTGLPACSWVMARGGCSSLDEYIMAGDSGAVGKSNLVTHTVNLGRCCPLVGDSMSWSERAALGFLLTFRLLLCLVLRLGLDGSLTCRSILSGTTLGLLPHNVHLLFVMLGLHGIPHLLVGEGGIIDRLRSRKFRLGLLLLAYGGIVVCLLRLGKRFLGFLKLGGLVGYCDLKFVAHLLAVLLDKTLIRLPGIRHIFSTISLQVRIFCITFALKFRRIDTEQGGLIVSRGRPVRIAKGN